MDAGRIAEALQDAEIIVLKALAKRALNPDEIAKSTLLGRDIVSRACLWLQNKNLVTVKETPQTFAAIEKLGEQYAKEGLPEKKFLFALKNPMFPNQIAESAKLDRQEMTYSLGFWKKRGAVKFEDSKIKLIAPELVHKKLHEELFLEKLAKEKEMEMVLLLPEEKHAFEELRTRGIVKKVERTAREFSITDLGRKVISAIKDEKRIGLLTSSLIKTGAWKDASFRRYDVEAIVPKLYPGKKQAYDAFLDEVKEELISLGFEEMSGPLVELSFFNNDALFMPQDHPARGIHDVYFVNEPKYGNLEKFQRFLAEVKKVHETGGKSGSTGWQYSFNQKESCRLVLRSQGTALSARTLASNPKIPGAYFAISRVYRPEKLDATHLSEFNQLEGIVIGNYNFRHLLGLLANFAKTIAKTNKVRFKPAYFPFTEPSINGEIWHHDLNRWLETLQAGIFRPEVTEPFGINVPVLAWGIGVDRLFMIREKISDIRQLFSQDIEWLRSVKI